ncbi:unnamed protein product [Periconia digitata]|uniref:AB hydrolase-1 domain-containing protein n=1 Tax=Periconia digitata TaxID=1303443 RepID=A0A9W4UPP0_9PLEO|nr:unnamed protein product [Periconia digitata]
MAFHRRVQMGLLLAAAGIANVAATKQCVEFELPISVDTTNEHYNIRRVDNDVDAVQWALDSSIWNQTFGKIIDHVNITTTYNISAELCVPSEKSDKSDILQIAVHGNAWDKRAWDVQVRPEQQSYVDAAIAKGYSILTFDRIGTGQSTLVNAYDDAQPNTEIEILAQITTLARSGKLLSGATIISNTTAIPSPTPKKIVHVGHSFGSLLIFGLLKKQGDLSDGALLTGFLNSSHLRDVPVATFEHAYAATHDPARFGTFGSGYVVLTSLNTLQKLYFTKATLDAELLEYTERIKQPEPVAVYASAGQVFGSENTNLFRGPVQLIAGEADFVTCNGYCPGTYDEEEMKDQWFQNAANLTVYIAPDTAHVLNVATSASATYKKMLDYLEEHGL